MIFRTGETRQGLALWRQHEQGKFWIGWRRFIWDLACCSCIDQV